MIPATHELLETSCCQRSVSEVLRMERVVLTKFDWDLRMTTPLDFLNIVSLKKISDNKRNYYYFIIIMSLSLSRIPGREIE